MKLNLLTPINQINTPKYNQNPAFRAKFFKPTFDSFEISPSTVEKLALPKLKQYTKSEYDSLSILEKSILRSSAQKVSEAKSNVYDLFQDIKFHHFIAGCIEQALNLQYGVGNYVVVPIGRSLSSIGKLLSLKIGEENVKNIPLSNLSEVDNSSTTPIEHFRAKADIDAYRKYLDSIGLSRENVENSGKNYIILDYAFTGNSIKNAYKILTSDDFWGNKKKNVTFSSIQDFFTQKNYIKERAILVTKMLYGKYKAYSLINRLEDASADGIKKALDIETSDLTNEEKYINKLFGFVMLDSVYGESKPEKSHKFKPNTEAPYKNQEKLKWLSPASQFNKDVFIDIYELEKILLSTSDLKLKEHYKTLVTLLKRTTSDDYYSTFKQHIEGILKFNY